MVTELTIDPKLDALLTKYGNLMFDCGEWNDDSENWPKYEDLSDACARARNELVLELRARQLAKPVEAPLDVDGRPVK